MNSVFIVQHTHETGDGTEDVKFVGVYSSRLNAQEAVRRLRAAPGFADAPDGFSIDEYRVDHDHWVEGFATVADA